MTRGAAVDRNKEVRERKGLGETKPRSQCRREVVVPLCVSGLD